MLLPKMWKATSANDASNYLDMQKNWCDNKDTIMAIQESAKYAFTQLKSNTTPKWWPDELPQTQDSVLLETRCVILRSRAYDIGIELFLKKLSEFGFIEKSTVYQIGSDEKELFSPWINEALLAQSYFDFNQMLAFAQLKDLFPTNYYEIRNKRETHLGKIAKLFGLDGPNAPIQFRLNKLVRFASIGFLTHEAVNGRYESMIELGPAGREFFTQVYVPIINHMPLYN